MSLLRTLYSEIDFDGKTDLDEVNNKGLIINHLRVVVRILPFCCCCFFSFFLFNNNWPTLQNCVRPIVKVCNSIEIEQKNVYNRCNNDIDTHSQTGEQTNMHLLQCLTPIQLDRALRPCIAVDIQSTFTCWKDPCLYIPFNQQGYDYHFKIGYDLWMGVTFHSWIPL